MLHIYRWLCTGLRQVGGHTNHLNKLHNVGGSGVFNIMSGCPDSSRGPSTSRSKHGYVIYTASIWSNEITMMDRVVCLCLQISKWWYLSPKRSPCHLEVHIGCLPEWSWFRMHNCPGYISMRTRLDPCHHQTRSGFWKSSRDTKHTVTLRELPFKAAQGNVLHCWPSISGDRT